MSKQEVVTVYTIFVQMLKRKLNINDKFKLS